MHTQVGIVGAGPAGLMLALLLGKAGISSVVLEAKSRRYVEERIRAGVLEHTTVELMTGNGAGERLAREGLVHSGFEMRFGGKRRRIDLAALTGGRTITVYPQHEVVKDLIAARLAAGGEIKFEADVTDIDGIEGTKPVIHYREGGTDKTLTCDFIAGCDGFHGVCRPAMPAKVMNILDRTYPFAWLGILAQAAPASHELIYTNHERGFSLLSMRTPRITRLYLQCAPDEDIAQWSDDRIWAELHERNRDVDGLLLNEGPITQKGITPMRSFVAEPMRHGRLFLMGDAAHIVPPTGAKGLNLAINDVRVFARAAVAFYRDGGTGLLDAYSETCLKRVWRVQHFSWWMTSMLHRFPDASEFERRLQMSELDFVTSNEAAGRALAENYVGLPYE
jgi:p-hydroxybenzoate 3-monooxygenase